MLSITYLMLRSGPLRDAACGGSSGQGARLEARTTLLQPRCDRVDQFPDSRESGGPELAHCLNRERPPRPLGPGFPLARE
jgi:hypothetical protein